MGFLKVVFLSEDLSNVYAANTAEVMGFLGSQNWQKSGQVLFVIIGNSILVFQLFSHPPKI